MIVDALGSATAAGGAATVKNSAAVSQPGGESLGDAFGKLVDGAVGTLQQGESIAVHGLLGAASPLKVVDAVMAAQRTLQAAVAIRDKAVSAYQEISRMTI